VFELPLCYKGYYSLIRVYCWVRSRGGFPQFCDIENLANSSTIFLKKKLNFQIVGREKNLAKISKYLLKKAT
jgi:hypothetical protein